MIISQQHQVWDIQQALVMTTILLPTIDFTMQKMSFLLHQPVIARKRNEYLELQNQLTSVAYNDNEDREF